MTLQYTVNREQGLVTIDLDNSMPVDLDESDLTTMLNDLQGVAAYTPEPRTGEL